MFSRLSKSWKSRRERRTCTLIITKWFTYKINTEKVLWDFRRERQIILSNLRKALCREWHMSGVLRNGKIWEHVGKSFEALGTMNRKQGCSCGMLVLSGSNVSAYAATMTNKKGKSELIPACGELWMQDKRIWIFSADNGESLKESEEGQDIFWSSFWCYWSKSQSGKMRGRESTEVGSYCEMIDKTRFGQRPWSWRESRWWVWGTYWGNSNSTNSYITVNIYCECSRA